MRPPLLAPICLVVGALLGLAGTFISARPGLELGWRCARYRGSRPPRLPLPPGLRRRLRGIRRFHGGPKSCPVGRGHVVGGERALVCCGRRALGGLAGSGERATRVPDCSENPGSHCRLLFAAMSLQVFAGKDLTPLSEPLPFFAYPFLVFTMFGWARACLREPSVNRTG
jgi:hypothetical protein